MYASVWIHSYKEVLINQMKLKTKKYIKPFNKSVLSVTVILSLIGLVMISSASAVLSFQRYETTNYFLIRQIIFFLIGLGLMLVISKIDYRIFKKYSALILLGTLGLLIAVLVPGIGFEVGGARRWINLGFSLLQPSEFAKLAVIFYLAAWFSERKSSISYFMQGLFPPLIVLGIVAGIVMMEPDFGSTAAIGLISLAVFYAGGAKLSHLLGLFAATIGSGWILIQAAPYRMARITSFLDPSADPLGISYQINQALIAIGSGGMWGQGFGYSRQKFNFLPEPIGDSIFAVMSEELGFIRILTVMALFAIFAVLGFRIAKNAPDDFGKLVAVGVTSWIIFQTVFNVGAMVGLLPLTGIPLPFISYGGSSMIATMIGVGVLLNISRAK